jgi:hypothetical protein
MIGNLVRRREQTENEAVYWTELRTPVPLTLADHMNRLVASIVRQAPQIDRKCWLARIRRLMAR